MSKSKNYVFEEFPELEERIHWIPLLNNPTPITKLEKVGEKFGFSELYMKRDDLTTEIYGGNKPRKLEYTFGRLIHENYEKVLTIGGLGSNHCLATAIFAKQKYNNVKDFEVLLVLMKQPLTSDVQKKLLMFYSLDCKLKYSGGLFGMASNYYFKKYPGTYKLWAGGTDPITNLGYVNAAFELKEQIDNGELPKPDIIFVTLGSVGTMAGLDVGLNLVGLSDIELIGVQVAMKILWIGCSAYSQHKSALKTLKLLKKYCNKVKLTKLKKRKILSNYMGKAYGYVTKDGQEAVKIVKELEDIKLDTTYTGKTFAGLLDYTEKFKLKDKTILFWNTYNSRPYTPFLKPDVDWKDLPKEFHQFFEKKVNNSKI
ncbi:MAG: 1-aminocyclopropane-1-carboxylate deaminase/D-cysteine desulfhydrase [Candidatus Helarchaeota archaeon]